jgi:hypothetical protein
MKPSSDTSEAKIEVHIDSDAALSPFVIELSHGDRAKTVPARLSSLARALESSATDISAIPQDELVASLEDLSHQFRDPDIATRAPLLQDAEEVVDAAALLAPAIPLEDLQATDIFAELDLSADNSESKPEQAIESKPLPNLNKRRLSPLDLLRSLPIYRMSDRLRAASAFVVLSFLVVFPLHAIQGVSSLQTTKTELTATGTAAVDTLLRGKRALADDRFSVASSNFERASEQFAEADESLDRLHGATALLVGLIPQTRRTATSVQGLVDAGKNLSLAASKLTEAADDLTDRPSLDLTTKLSLLTTYIEQSIPYLITANDALENVDASIIPEDYQSTISDLQETTPKLLASMKEFVSFSEILGMMLGGEDKMRYIISAQNPAELRATGGFSGTFVEPDLYHGAIEAMNIPGGGTYDLQGQSPSIEPPAPFGLVNERWEFQDLNWDPDFPTTARRTLDFYEAAGGPTVDGFVSINSTVVPRLLEVLGPIEMPDYDTVVDAENFLFVTQKIVDMDYAIYADEDTERIEEAPKAFLADFAPVLLERIQEADVPVLLSLLDVVGDALNTDDIYVYFADNDLQSAVQARGWTGAIRQTEGDYLRVVHTTLGGGGKTGFIIDQDVEVDIAVDPDGMITNHVTITKTHRGMPNTVFEGYNEVDYLRLYVPEGSELITADGFEIPPDDLFKKSDIPLLEDKTINLIESNRTVHAPTHTDVWNEHGKTVFGNYMQTKPGEIEVVTFTYILPMRMQDLTLEPSFFEKALDRLGSRDLEPYTFLLEKQPGVYTRSTEINLQLSDDRAVIWTSNEGADGPEGILLDNTYDHLVRLLIENTFPYELP